MINNPELPGQISERSTRHIDQRVDSAAFVVSQAIYDDGHYDFYRQSWRTLPKPLKNNIRLLTDSYYPPREEDDNGTRRSHPFSFAAEEGLVTGMVFAEEALRTNTAYATFTKRMTGEFVSLRKNLAASAYDLADVLQRAGSSFASHLEERVTPPYIVRLDTRDDSPIEMQRQSIYANAVGFVGAALLTKMIEQEVKKSQPKDRRSERSIRRDLDFLSDETTAVTITDFGA